MSKGLKVWLWIVLVVNAISIIGSLASIVLAPVTGIIAVVSTVVLVAGVCMILFKQKKLGFYLVVAAAVINLIVNIVGGTGIVFSLISAVVMPLIIYLLMKPNWDSFQ